VTITPTLVLAATLALLPFLAAAFFPTRFAACTRTLPLRAQLLAPSLLCIPYLLVAHSTGLFRWHWLTIYSLLPVATATLLHQAKQLDPMQHGNWRDFVILATLGLAVDLRWFEPAWPPHLAAFNKILLLDAGIWGFFVLRQLEGTGFNLRISPSDVLIALREFALYTPIAIAVGLWLGFLHFHPVPPHPLQFAATFAFTFFFIAVPEELFFRGWLQNLLERRLGRTPALILTAVIFGLSHFNKRTVHFNWRYVLLAAIAGIFYGRAWRQDRRVAASALTHTTVDTVWSIWLR
jgi:uncharacterized protein